MQRATLLLAGLLAACGFFQPPTCDDAAPASCDGATLVFCQQGIEFRQACGDLACVEGPQGASCAPTCGDGALQGDEECDDGGTTPGDGCDEKCQLEPICGNDVRESGEDCDGNDLGGQSCSSLGLGSGPLSCLGGCAFDTSLCVKEICQNGLDDDGDLAVDCADSDCDSELGCQIELICGDRIDNDNDQATDCQDSDCVDDPACPAVCGDGFLSQGELCDDGLKCANGQSCITNADCTDSSACLPRGGDGCDATCQPEGCNNGFISPGDVCLFASNASSLPLVTGPRDIAVGSLSSADNGLDVVIPSQGGGTTNGLVNNGDGQLGIFFQVGGGAPVSAAIGDIDGDGDNDIVRGESATPGLGFVLLDDGFFDPTAPQAPSVNAVNGNTPVDLLLVNLDGDTDLDILTADGAGGSVTIYFNNGSGGFGAITRNLPVGGTGTVHAVATADFNGDGRIDIAAAVERAGLPGDVVIFLQKSSNTFSGPADLTLRVGRAPRALAAGDLDADGFPDIVTADFEDDSLSVVRNAGNGTFLPAITRPLGDGPSSLALGDVDGDGAPDILAGNQISDSLSLVLNQGGLFNVAPNPAAVDNVSAVALADLNNDGALDILATSDFQGGFLIVILAVP